ncbi:hypothetical protein ACIBEH_32825 [Nocardia salmonicida]|uniref:hypothetical protein n=1 Tax=Nocardia salmonicida TaxID=53431 RepID=UPI0037BC3212
MTHRRSRTDGLSTHVANRLDREGIRRALSDLTFGNDDALDGLLAALEQPHRGYELYTLTQVINFLRDSGIVSLLHDPDRANKPADLRETCRNCGEPLPKRTPGTRGRRREFCAQSCKQMEYRNRSEEWFDHIRRNNTARLVNRGLALVRANRPDHGLDARPGDSGSSPVPIASITALLGSLREWLHNEESEEEPDSALFKSLLDKPASFADRSTLRDYIMQLNHSQSEQSD